MRLSLVGIIVLGTTLTALADSAGDHDITPVPVCGQLPSSAVLPIISISESQRICRAMGVLDGVRLQDIRNFSKAVVVLKHEGYPATDEEITKQLVEIIRLRGLHDKPDRWRSNLDVVVRVYQAFNGVVTPIDAIEFLSKSGEIRKTLSDDGFMDILIFVLEQKRQSN
jgi:hypothetical protein